MTEIITCRTRNVYMGMSADTPTVHLLATGGTIANPLDIDGYLSGSELVEAVPELEDVASLEVTDVASTGSSGISPAIWWDLHAAIESLAGSENPPDGIVITHGSNTLEETAYFLTLTLSTSIPVVLTAAQRNHRLIGNDGDRNLLDAVRVAGHPDARGRGVLVTVNDHVYQARDVTKAVSGRPDAWEAGDFGAVGLTDKYGSVEFYYRSDRPHTTETPFDIADVTADAYPTIGVVYSIAGADGTTVRGALTEGVDGLVVAALPTGAPAQPAAGPSQKAALEDAAASVPVVISHRGIDGWPTPAYKDDDRFIWGDTLTPQKAAILLALGLLEEADHDELTTYFETY